MGTRTLPAHLRTISDKYIFTDGQSWYQYDRYPSEPRTPEQKWIVATLDCKICCIPLAFICKDFTLFEANYLNFSCPGIEAIPQ